MNREDLPNIDFEQLQAIDCNRLFGGEAIEHKPRILLLYGSLRERSFSRLATEEAARLLQFFGAETRIFNPSGLPLPDDCDPDHPKVVELRELAAWSEGMVWCSPEMQDLFWGTWKS